jgi:phosphate transport system permease protein
MHSSALVALGLVLFVITLIVLAAARLMLQRMNRRAGA